MLNQLSQQANWELVIFLLCNKPALSDEWMLDSDYKNIIHVYLNCGLISEDESDLCCNEQYLTSMEYKAWKKIYSLIKEIAKYKSFLIFVLCTILGLTISLDLYRYFVKNCVFNTLSVSVLFFKC